MWIKIIDGIRVSAGLYILINILPVSLSVFNANPWNSFIKSAFPDSIYMQSMYVEGIVIVGIVLFVALVCIIRWLFKPLLK